MIQKFTHRCAQFFTPLYTKVFTRIHKSFVKKPSEKLKYIVFCDSPIRFKLDALLQCKE